MLDSNSLPDDFNPTPADPPLVRPRSRADHALELGVFLMLFVPSIIYSFFVTPSWMSQGFTVTAFGSMLRQASFVTLILYFLHQNGEPLRRIGWSFRFWPSRVVIGVIALPFLLGVAINASQFFIGVGLSSLKGPVPEALAIRSWSQIPLAVVLIAVIAVGEETMFRGYLILRLKEATGNVPLAVVLSTMLFALGHTHLGTAGMATVGMVGLCFAGLYVWTESLLAPIVVHFLYDLYWMVILPLLRSR
jgi:membrane protease YdiL (CAAX protease family)